MSAKITSINQKIYKYIYLSTKDIPIFVDQNLGNKKGTIESKKIADLGFVNINIRTGLPEDIINKPKYINHLLGKYKMTNLKK